MATAMPAIVQQIDALAVRQGLSHDEAHLRIGFVISKRVSKHAVARNYFKRLLSEATRSVLARISGSWDIVLSAKHQITSADLPTLTDDITVLLRRARLLNSR